MSPRPAPEEYKFQEAAALLRSNPTRARRLAERLLRRSPEDPAVLSLVGAARRLSSQPGYAIDILRKATSLAPDFALAHMELGLSHLALNQSDQAAAALERAVVIDVGLPIAWKALSQLRAAQGDFEGGEEAAQHHLNLSAGDPKLLAAGQELLAGHLAKAEVLCRECLKAQPTNVSAIRMLAEIGIKLGRLNDAEKLLSRALELAPDFHLARSNYANVLFKKFQYPQALAQLDQVLAAEPEQPGHLLLKASVLVRTGETAAAVEIYQQVLAAHPGQALTQLSLGHALKTLGHQELAVAAYRRGIELRPGLGEAYWSLANLKTYRFKDDDVTRMRTEIARPGGRASDYYHLLFALGKSLEDRGDFSEAFAAYQRGNAVRRKTVKWNAEEHEANLEKLRRFFDRSYFGGRSSTGCQSDEPIFIVGLPRAGSTLLEQILASHSQVDGTMELPDIISIARRLSGRKTRGDADHYPGVLAQLTDQQLAALGEEYLERTTIHRQGAPRFIDKMPNNFAHVGLIQLILPNAKIIDARRHPLACCFSGYKQLFAAGQNFTYDLDEIGRYYRSYVELMAHWDTVLPGRVLRVDYEQVVSDIESQVVRLLDYCGLPFEEACLQFHQTERAVRTASSEQVRQPLYESAVTQWRHFDKELQVLRLALGERLANTVKIEDS